MKQREIAIRIILSGITIGMIGILASLIFNPDDIPRIVKFFPGIGLGISLIGSGTL